MLEYKEQSLRSFLNNFFKIILCLILSLSSIQATPLSNSDDFIQVSDTVVQQYKKQNSYNSLNFITTRNKKSNDKIKNINVILPEDEIISQSSTRINAIYPFDNPQNNYPGYRGTNQLVIYTSDFGHTTGTNEFGKEAVVQNGIVTALTGANSIIPSNGFIISGHGKAKKWINDNLKIGVKIDI
ncbi:hypothetical protein IJ670_08110, partial [bacterium]|nr:hypothetical protein [bacterium]